MSKLHNHLSILNLGSRRFTMIRYSQGLQQTEFDLIDFVIENEKPEGTWEFWYALREEVDTLMALNLGDSMTFNISRDCPEDGTATIWRTN